MNATLPNKDGKILIPHNLLIDKPSQDIFKMYLQCKDLNVTPFTTSYWDQPGWWLDAYDVITATLQSARSVREKTDEHKRKSESKGQNPREKFKE